jgi:hypothetical protein
MEPEPGGEIRSIQQSSEDADNEAVTHPLGWLIALVLLPFFIQVFRRGWSRPTDLGRFYVLFGCLLWALETPHRVTFRLPSLFILVQTLAATVLFWFACPGPRSGGWLEPGADRLPAAFERRLIRWLLVRRAWYGTTSPMAFALAAEAVVVVLFGTWLGHFVPFGYPLSVTVLVLTLGLFLVAARAWKQAGRLL